MLAPLRIRETPSRPCRPAGDRARSTLEQFGGERGSAGTEADRKQPTSRKRACPPTAGRPRDGHREPELAEFNKRRSARTSSGSGGIRCAEGDVRALGLRGWSGVSKVRRSRSPSASAEVVEFAEVVSRVAGVEAAKVGVLIP